MRAGRSSATSRTAMTTALCARSCASWRISAAGSAIAACHILRHREGLTINRKKTQRLYREEGLAVRRREGRKRAVGAPAPAPNLALPNVLRHQTDLERGARMVRRCQDRIALYRSRQAHPERVRRELGFAALRVNGRMRDELPGETLFISLGHGREKIAAWAHDYNTDDRTPRSAMPAGCPGDTFLHDASQMLHDRFEIGHSTIQIERDESEACVLAPLTVV